MLRRTQIYGYLRVFLAPVPRGGAVAVTGAAGFITEDLDEAGPARKRERRAVYFGTDPRNDRTRALFGIDYRNLDDSLRDMAESLIGVGEVVPVPSPGFSLNRS